MITKINLLPIDGRPDLSSINKILFTIVLFIIVLYVSVSVYFLYQSWHLNEAINNVDNMSSMLKGTEEKINELQEKEKVINNKVALLENLTKARVNKYPLLLQVNNNIPAGVWAVKITNDLGSNVSGNANAKSANNIVKNNANTNQKQNIPAKMPDVPKNTDQKGTNKKNEEARQLMISGIADTFILVAKTSDALKGDIFFKNVEIINTEEGKGSLKTFLINCEY